MGLAGAIQEVLHVDLYIVSCPKCLTWWTCIIWTVLHEYGLVESVAASFIASYCATWLALVYDGLAVIYNSIYERITKTTDTSEIAENPVESDEEAGPDEVS